MWHDRNIDPPPDTPPRRPLTLRELEDQLDWLENQQRANSPGESAGLFSRIARSIASAASRLVGGRPAPVRAPLVEPPGVESAEIADVLNRLAPPQDPQPQPPSADEPEVLPEPIPSAAPIPIPSWRRPSVLVVEDDRSARATLTAILERSAFDVWEAGTVQEAIGRLAERPDWVLLDLMLPDGSGCAVLENANAQGIGSRVCVISGAGPTMIGEARSLGVRHVLPKPLNLPRLMDILAT